MSKITKIWTKIRRKWAKIRLKPIQVYCFHHVCAEFNDDSMNRDDWMSINAFKAKINSMQKAGIEFISLTDAYQHMCNDRLRAKRYAVLTFDDGYSSLKEILPWLKEYHIPATLFINGKYLDGKSYRKTPKEKYLTSDELFALTSPLIEIGSHGWEHIDATQITELEFMESIERNVQLLSHHPRYIPFHAYTWGRQGKGSYRILKERNVIPVLIDRGENYNDARYIHRELLK